MGGATASNGTPKLRVVGRTAPGTAAGTIRFSWPGVSIHGRFTGTQVSMDLNDGTNKNRFTVVIDKGAPKTVTSTAGQTSLPLASGLANGTHEIVVWRNTEASMGVTQFAGLSNFGTGGALLAPPDAPERRIEVIGDSLSVGAGDEGNATCTGGIDAFTNNYLAYGSVAARTVGADVVTIAWSGIGVLRNYDGSTSNIMPARYPFAVANDKSGWDFSNYQPHVVVINLGTNDFGAGDPGTAYEAAYVSFIRTVRSQYTAAYFILIDMYGGNRRTRIDNVVAQLKASGESKLETLSLSSVQNNLGCNQHPNVTAHAAMGNVLAARLKTLMNW
jgi:lysophospholipase L1-like esterase